MLVEIACTAAEREGHAGLGIVRGDAARRREQGTLARESKPSDDYSSWAVTSWHTNMHTTPHPLQYFQLLSSS